MSVSSVLLTSIAPTLIGGAIGSVTTFWQMRRSQLNQEVIARLQIDAQRDLQESERTRTAIESLCANLGPYKHKFRGMSASLGNAKRRGLTDEATWEGVRNPHVKHLDGEFEEILDTLMDSFVFYAWCDIDSINNAATADNLSAVTIDQFSYQIDYISNLLGYVDAKLTAILRNENVPSEPEYSPPS
jgi:hypothetical protein